MVELKIESFLFPNVIWALAEEIYIYTLKLWMILSMESVTWEDAGGHLTLSAGSLLVTVTDYKPLDGGTNAHRTRTYLVCIV